MLRAILGLIPAIIVAIILFLISPILGVLWIIWLVLVAIWTLRKDLIMRFLEWLFGAKK
jgi:hypothetical protein